MEDELVIRVDAASVGQAVHIGVSRVEVVGQVFGGVREGYTSATQPKATCKGPERLQFCKIMLPDLS